MMCTPIAEKQPAEDKNACQYLQVPVEANGTTEKVGWLGMMYTNNIVTAAGRHQADCRQISHLSADI